MRLVVASTAGLCAAAAFFGLRYGHEVATTTETDVIEAYAARYVATRGAAGSPAQPTDCVAFPGADREVWLVVSCGPTPFDPARHYEYHVNRRGGLEHLISPQTRDAGRDLPEYDT